MRSVVRACVLFGLSLLLCACQPEGTTDPNQIRVGTIAGPESLLLEKAAEVAKRDAGIEVDIVEFEDFMTPNIALSDGAIDANMFQHQPYLELSSAARDLDLVAVGRTFVYPMGVYSEKYTSIEDVPDSARVGVPNDPSNEARALLLLEYAGAITLDYDSYHADIHDIHQNPDHWQFVALDAAQLPRTLSDLDIAVINTNFAIPAGLTLDDALVVEPPSSPYANLLVTREDNKDNPAILALVDALHSEEVLSAASQLFKGFAVPAWDVSTSHK